MRLLKKWTRLNYDEKRQRIEPFRTFYLTGDELRRVKELPIGDDGNIISSHDSEALLKEILEARGMGSLLYPDLERDDWSGYVKVFDSGLFWML